MMRLIVTNRERDYIFASDFDVLAQHLDEVVKDVCPGLSPQRKARTLQFIHMFSVLAGVPKNWTEITKYFVLVYLTQRQCQQIAVGLFFVYSKHNRKQPNQGASPPNLVEPNVSRQFEAVVLVESGDHLSVSYF